MIEKLFSESKQRSWMNLIRDFGNNLQQWKQKLKTIKPMNFSLLHIFNGEKRKRGFWRGSHVETWKTLGKSEPSMVYKFQFVSQKYHEQKFCKDFVQQIKLQTTPTLVAWKRLIFKMWNLLRHFFSCVTIFKNEFCLVLKLFYTKTALHCDRTINKHCMRIVTISKINNISI